MVKRVAWLCAATPGSWATLSSAWRHQAKVQTPSTRATSPTAERPVLHASLPTCEADRLPRASNHVACMFQQNSVLKVSQLDTSQDVYSCSMLGCNPWES